MTTIAWSELHHRRLGTLCARVLIVTSCAGAGGCPASNTKEPPKSTKDAGNDRSSITGDAQGDAGRHKGHVVVPQGQQETASLEDGGTVDEMPQAHADAATPSEWRDAMVEADTHVDAGFTDTGTGEVMQNPSPSIPSDPGERGPWPVGVQTLSLDLGTGQHVAVEVWYPARLGSDSGQTSVTYDFLDYLPPEATAALPAGEKPVPVACDCYRGLPLDTEHGPYPISILVHHTGQFRVASVSLMTHWASRGFVVVAADHPKLTLADVLADQSSGTCSGSGISIDSEYKRDVPAILRELRQPEGDFGFLAGHLDASRIAISGNGDGAMYSAAASGESGVRLIMQWAAPTTVVKRGDLAAVVFITGTANVGAPSYGSVQSVFQTTASRIRPTLLVGVTNAGPLSNSEVCNARSPMGRTGIDLAQKYYLCDINFDLLSAFFPCSSTLISQSTANHIFSYATTAALEEFVEGKDESAAWAAFDPSWGVVQQQR